MPNAAIVLLNVSGLLRIIPCVDLEMYSYSLEQALPCPLSTVQLLLGIILLQLLLMSNILPEQ
jgi:hypothetical protein